MKAQSEDRATYVIPVHNDDSIIRAALAILDSRMRANPVVMSSPQAVKDYLRLHIGDREHEVFVALWLDAQNRLIASEELFRGTLTQTSVYPREVVKAGLACNAGAVILAHNHPSGFAEPSAADRALTDTLVAALKLIDIKVLDHIIVAIGEATSMVERGLM